MGQATTLRTCRACATSAIASERSRLSARPRPPNAKSAKHSFAASAHQVLSAPVTTTRPGQRNGGPSNEHDEPADLQSRVSLEAPVMIDFEGLATGWNLVDHYTRADDYL